MKDLPAYDDLFAIRRFVREPERAYGYDAAVAERLRERILATFGERVRKIILFGSRVRGDALPDSDYDVLVVLDKVPQQEWHQITVDLYAACRGSGAPIEPHPMAELEFEETKGVIGGLAYPAAKEGVLLYENA